MERVVLKGNRELPGTVVVALTEILGSMEQRGWRAVATSSMGHRLETSTFLLRDLDSRVSPLLNNLQMGIATFAAAWGRDKSVIASG